MSIKIYVNQIIDKLPSTTSGLSSYSVSPLIIKTTIKHSKHNNIQSPSLLLISIFLIFAFLLISFSSWALANSQVLYPASSNLSPSLKSTKTIGISQIIEHAALDIVRNSMIDALKSQGFEEGKNLIIHYENAHGNMVTATQIATKLVASDINVLIGISTPSAQTLLQTAQKMNKKIPIVFTAVTDASQAKLTREATPYPITGVTDEPNLKGFMELLNTLMPNLKRLGVLYNPSEANSVSTINRLKQLLKEKNIELIEASVNNTADVPQATQSLIGKVDVIYFPQDNTLVAAMQSVISIANQAPMPVPIILPIYSDDPQIMKGVLAANGFDYRDIGYETGIMIAKILKKQEDGMDSDMISIPIQTPPFSKTVINQSLAEKLGLTVPKELNHSKIQIFVSK